MSLPQRIIDDREMSPRVRVLAWLMAHGASPLKAVRVHQSALARQLQLGETTVRHALKRLAQTEYIAIVHDPMASGNVRSYRLLFSHERKGATA